MATRHAIIRKTELEIEGTLEHMAKLKKEESAKVGHVLPVVQKTVLGCNAACCFFMPSVLAMVWDVGPTGIRMMMSSRCSEYRRCLCTCVCRFHMQALVRVVTALQRMALQLHLEFGQSGHACASHTCACDCSVVTQMERWKRDINALRTQLKDVMASTEGPQGAGEGSLFAVYCAAQTCILHRK